MATVNEVFEFMNYLKYKGYGHYEVVQGYDANCAFEIVNVKDAKLDTESHEVLLPCDGYKIDKERYDNDLIPISAIMIFETECNFKVVQDYMPKPEDVIKQIKKEAKRLELQDESNQ